MIRFPDPPGTPRRLAIWLTVSAGLLASLAAYLSIPRAAGLAPAVTRTSPAPESPVHSIILIHDEPDLPAGPHRETFVARCTACHSPRLVANQPPFPARNGPKWCTRW